MLWLNMQIGFVDLRRFRRFPQKTLNDAQTVNRNKGIRINCKLDSSKALKKFKNIFKCEMDNCLPIAKTPRKHLWVWGSEKLDRNIEDTTLSVEHSKMWYHKKQCDAVFEKRSMHLLRLFRVTVRNRFCKEIRNSSKKINTIQEKKLTGNISEFIHKQKQIVKVEEMWNSNRQRFPSSLT